MAILTGSIPLTRIPAGPSSPARGGRIGVIRDDPASHVSCGVRREAGHGRRGGRLVQGAEQDAGPVRDKCLRRGESETAAAAGHQVNPVPQSKIHPAILPGY